MRFVRGDPFFGGSALIGKFVPCARNTLLAVLPRAAGLSVAIDAREPKKLKWFFTTLLSLLIPGPSGSSPNQSPFRHPRELRARALVSLCAAGHTIRHDCSGSRSHRGVEDQRLRCGLGSELRGETMGPVGLPAVFAIAAGEGFNEWAIVDDPAPLLTIAGNPDQTVSLSWSGAGALEQTESLAAPNWQPVPQAPLIPLRPLKTSQ